MSGFNGNGKEKGRREMAPFERLHPSSPLRQTLRSRWRGARALGETGAADGAVAKGTLWASEQQSKQTSAARVNH